MKTQPAPPGVLMTTLSPAARDRHRSAGSGRRLRILAVGDVHTASTRYRVLAHGGALRDAGFEVDLRLEGTPPGPGAARRILRVWKLVRDAPRRGETDLLLVHRRTFPPPFHRLIARARVPFVFDMDDALDLPPPGREASASARRRYRSNFSSTVGLANLVVCGNELLAKRVPHDRTTVIETPVDCTRFTPQAIRRGARPVIGWVGHSDNLRYLESLHDVLVEIAARHPGTRVKVVADAPPRLPGLEVEFQSWRLENEVSCFDEMTVGLMPLDDTAWTRSKCAFKLLQYMALGIPAVASPVGMNRTVVEHGVSGLLAQSSDAWLGGIDALLSDPSLARSVAERARTVVTSRYSLELASARLIAALSGLGA